MPSPRGGECLCAPERWLVKFMGIKDVGACVPVCVLFSCVPGTGCLTP